MMNKPNGPTPKMPNAARLAAQWCLAAIAALTCIHALAARSGESTAPSEAKLIELSEFRTFPESYLGKRIKFFGLVTNVGSCKAPGNRGLTCAVVRSQHSAETILINGAFAPSQLVEWARDGSAVEFTGKVEMRATVKDGKQPLIVVTEASAKPKHAPTLAPLKPDWKSTSAPQLGETVLFDANSVESGGGDVSAWILANHATPANEDGGTAMSTLYWLTFSCDGSRAVFRRTTHYQETFGRGSLRGRDDLEEEWDTKSRNLSKNLIFDAGILSLHHLCR